MKAKDISMKISRRNGELVGVSILMPTWLNREENGIFTVKLPLLGDVQTYAMNEEDVTVAVNEAFKSFCIIAEKFGKGLEKELQMLGWEKNPKKQKTIALLRYKSDSNPVLDGITNTGYSTALSFNFNPVVVH